MYISNVKLKNWKNFLEVETSVSERTFIVGPNASGKSNFLDVFRFLRDVAREGGGLQEAVKHRGGLSKIRCLAATRSADVEIEIELSDSKSKKPLWKYRLTLTQSPAGFKEPKAIVRGEQVWQNEGPTTSIPILNRPIKDDKEDNELLEQTHLQQITSNRKFRELVNFFKQIDYQHIIPQLIRDPASFEKTSSTEDFFGRDLFEKMNQMPANTRNSQLKKIESSLKYAVPNLNNISLETDKAGVPHLQAIYQHWRPQGAKQNEEQFSDGTLRLIGLLFVILNGREPLLLEEPELSLHSAIIKKLSEGIYLMQKRKGFKRQVILSTHSYELLDNKGIRPEEILIIKPEDKRVTVKNCASLEDIKHLLESGLSPAEVVIPRTKGENIDQMFFQFSKSN